MAKLTIEEKERRKFDRQLEYARTFYGSNYLTKKVKPIFCEMKRAEAGVKKASDEICVVRGVIDYSYRGIGEVICVTCGKRGPWKNSGGTHGSMDAGHYLQGNRVLLCEMNCHPQCVSCNQHNSGESAIYRKFMVHVYGEDAVDELHRKKNRGDVPSLDEQVRLKFSYQDRLKKAVEAMK